MHVLHHPSVQASIGSAAVLASIQWWRPLPWPVWAAWGALAAIGLRQAVRDR